MRFDPRLPGPRALRMREHEIERDVDDEIAFHLESRMRALVDEGHPADESRRIAELEFGDLRAARRELTTVDRRRRRRAGAREAVSASLLDVRHTVRSLRRSPSFTIGAVATLTIGVAAVVAVFTVVNAVILRPPPFKDPDRLVGAWHDLPPMGLAHEPQTATTFFTYRSQARTIEAIGVYLDRAANVADPQGTTDPQRLIVSGFSAELFEVLGVSPLRGRVFTRAEDRPGAAPVMLVSEGMWRARFAADPTIIGRSLDVDGIRREIIGVMPERFRFPSAASSIWIPLALDEARPPADAYNYRAVARLAPGVSIEDAQRDFARVLPRIVDLYPTFVPGITTRAMMEQVKPVPVLTPFRDDYAGGLAEPLWMMTAAALLVLGVATVNVANLTFVRADARGREIAVRQAIGASRARVVRHLASESAVIALTAAVLATTLAWVMIHVLVATAPSDLPRLAEIRVDGASTLAGVLVAALAAFGSNALPAVRVTRGGPARLAAHEARWGTVGRAHRMTRSTMVVVQVALSLVVLAGSGLLVRSFSKLRAVRPGFDGSGVTAFWVSLPRARYARDTAQVRFYATLADRVARLAGVQSVGLTSRLPFIARGDNQNPLYAEDVPVRAGTMPPLELFTTISGAYFETMRIPLLAGKRFDPVSTQREGDAIVSSRAAELFWNDRTGVKAIGKRFRALPTGPWYTVVGVVGDVRDTALVASPSATVYFPEIIQRDSVTRPTARTMALVVRSDGDGRAITPEVRRIVRDLDPSLPVFDVQPMSAVIRSSTSRVAFATMILGAAAAITLLLGALGLYGVMAYVVTLRRRELAIRIALGATPRRVAAAMTGQGIALTTAGIAMGLALFALAARFLTAFVFGVEPSDPITLAGATALLVATAVIASWIPAVRAGRIDPAETLRAE